MRYVVEALVQRRRWSCMQSSRLWRSRIRGTWVPLVIRQPVSFSDNAETIWIPSFLALMEREFWEVRGSQLSSTFLFFFYVSGIYIALIVFKAWIRSRFAIMSKRCLIG